ncbi:MAG: 4-alpha-glucanotransferase, partial [Clostridia bacterium]|nr:4-alpha-glucanotransferase [Clostridia bacterium]
MPSRDKTQKRYIGVLLAVSSLPSNYGIGSFGIEAYKFIDFLSEAKQRFWQILPLNPLGEGNSPYKSVSTFAGEILYIDLDFLARDGLLKEWDIKPQQFSQITDYDVVREFKIPLLYKAAKNFDLENRNYQKFLNDNKFWLNDYALFTAALNIYETQKLTDLPDGIKYRVPQKIASFEQNHKKLIDFYKVTQYFFFCQYYALKRYANSKGVKIIGDIPFYVSPDSVDVWVSPDNFLLSRDFTPTAVAGVPPDVFSRDGQLWGNPIYNWENMRSDNYTWWQKRLEFCQELYDVIRIDHFRAFARFSQIPYGKTTLSGEWVDGDGATFWDSIKENLCEINI